jgi:hypothetical protein
LRYEVIVEASPLDRDDDHGGRGRNNRYAVTAAVVEAVRRMLGARRLRTIAQPVIPMLTVVADTAIFNGTTCAVTPPRNTGASESVNSRFKTVAIPAVT